MSLPRIRPAWLLIGSAALLGLGGCPKAQTPPPENAPPPGETAQNPPQTTPGVQEGTGDEPADPGTTSSTSSGQTGGGSTAFSFTLSDPQSLVTIRPGPPLRLRYAIIDPSGLAAKAEFVLAPDANADGVADRLPVYARPVSASAGPHEVSFETADAELISLLPGGYGRFLAGLRVERKDGPAQSVFAPGAIVLDTSAAAAQWIEPGDDRMVSPGPFPIRFRTIDNGSHTYRVVLDPDENPANGNEFPLIPATTVAAGGEFSLQPVLGAVPSGTYRVLLTVSDSIDPPHRSYAPRADGQAVRILITRRLVGDFDLASLADSPQGAILEGFNFNDLAGSAMQRVPDLDGNGTDELLVAARFGKSQIIADGGVGFGEAYMIYGGQQRLRGSIALNRTGHDVPGLIFTGLRTPRNADIAPQNESSRWTEGLSDITVIPDMDGDLLPELVFGFPRCESVTIAQTNPTIQHPELFPDLVNMGLEYDAFDGQHWVPNTAQFTRGGIVIVSSHDYMMFQPERLSRKSNRIIDLPEVGQLFRQRQKWDVIPYIREGLRRNELPPERRGSAFICADCDGELPPGCDPGSQNCGDDGCAHDGTSLGDGRETEIERWVIQWDCGSSDQEPVAFMTPWSFIPVDPPLVNPVQWPFGDFPFETYPNHWIASGDGCTIECEVTNEWFVPGPDECAIPGAASWSNGGNPLQDPLPDCYPDNPCPVAGNPPPCGPDEPPCTDPPVTVTSGDYLIWSPAMRRECISYTEAWFPALNGETYSSSIGARILGQKVDDRFGSQVSADGNWLFMSAPRRTANDAPYSDDVPSLGGSRSRSGVVYQLRTHAVLEPGGVTRTQLWMEPTPMWILRPCWGIPEAFIPPWWPYFDTEAYRFDPTIPFPHQYVIETVGSRVGTGPRIGNFGVPGQLCPPYRKQLLPPTYGVNFCSMVYPVGTAGYYVDRTPQIVGPHADAQIEYVRCLGDLNGDGVRDFAIGSAHVRQDVVNGTGPEVGALFIVFGRPSGLEGDYLLEQLALNVGDPSRLLGVLIKGSGPGETLARVVADAGDVNRDGFSDVLIGNEGFDGGRGEAILIYGSSSLVSPGGSDPGGAPGGGWTPDSIPPQRIVRISGANVGDFAGANVSGAGDVDGDGFADLLVASPGAAGGRGEVVLLYGGPAMPGTIDLGSLAPRNISAPYVRFTGRGAEDFLGAGLKVIPRTDPAGGSTTATSQGLAAIGDLDSDGAADFAISAMLADPGGRTDCGEVYVIYGRRGP